MFKRIKERWRKRKPPWVNPRQVSEVYDAEDYRQLMQRLELIERDLPTRLSRYRDHHTGQVWQGIAWDVGPVGAGNEVLSPISQRELNIENRHPAMKSQRS